MGRKTPSWMLSLVFAATFAPGVLLAQQVEPPAPVSVPSSVPAGTRFLVDLRDQLSTKDTKSGKHFKAKTLEPLVTSDGLVLPQGAEVRGHVSRVEPAVLTGRARLWLSFDYIKTPNGKAALIAEVAQVPGEHSVSPATAKKARSKREPAKVHAKLKRLLRALRSARWQEQPRMVEGEPRSARPSEGRAGS